ncbi:olfactory receptor 11H4-like [Discoglossus pictus]
MSVIECFIQFYICAAIVATECLLLTVMSYDRYLAICHPLHYSSIMELNICLQLIIWSWIIAFGLMLTPLILVSQLHLCGSNVIDHFFCDFDPILKLSCFDASNVKSKNLIASSSITLLPFTFITATYILIITAILKIPSTSGRKKTFLTCSSHLTVVSIFFTTLFAVYVIPNKDNSSSMNKILSLIYSVLTPFFNPFIYSLNNREMREVLQKLLKAVTEQI